MQKNTLECHEIYHGHNTNSYCGTHGDYLYEFQIYFVQELLAPPRAPPLPSILAGLDFSGEKKYQ